MKDLQFFSEVCVTFLHVSVRDLESRHLALGFGPGHHERAVGHITEGKIGWRLRACVQNMKHRSRSERDRKETEKRKAEEKSSRQINN